MRFPNIHVDIVGKDGNAFAILGACVKAAREGHVVETQINLFKKEATKGDYDHLIKTCIKWFNIN